ncbi:MAG: T9SS type A sorting domain-containing protein [Flavobacteriales bacterium]
MLLSRGIAEVAPDTFILATDAGFTALDQWGDWGSFTEFSTSLIPITGFGQVIVTGDPDPLFSNSLWSGHSVNSLPSGDLILSGRYASHGAVARTSRQGQLQGVFLPDPAPFSNYPAVLGGVTMLANGKLLFTFHERLVTNINDPYMPTQPSVVRVYHLDTLLNLECVLTIDGYVNNVHHWVNRTVATSDGGFILVGGRLDLNEQPPRWRYWAQKYPAGACFTAVEEHVAPGQVRVFPNPGSHEVNFNLNGPERAAHVELLDLQGRVVGIARFYFGQARINTQDQPAGMYAYRIIAGDGTPISAGRWVKE